jgi:hypothetical protein
MSDWSKNILFEADICVKYVHKDLYFIYIFIRLIIFWL